MTNTEAKSLSASASGREPIGDRRGFYIRFGVSKQNYGSPLADQWYERGDGGILLPVKLYQAEKEKRSNGRRVVDDF